MELHFTPQKKNCLIQYSPQTLRTETQDSKISLTRIRNCMIEKGTQFVEYLVKEYCNIFLGTPELNIILPLSQIFGLDHILEAFFFNVDYFLVYFKWHILVKK